MKKTFYITTPIFYINAPPTIGSAYPTIVADVLARWSHLKKIDTFFLTGLDENSSKTVKAAREKGYKDIQKYADDMTKKWIEVWKKLNISYSGFIRTTGPKHKKLVQYYFNKSYKNKDIYLGTYKGLYCDGCEEFKKESDLKDSLCPYHKTKPSSIKEKNYFFRLSKYQNKLINLIEKNKEFVLPKERKEEILNFVKSGLHDISISRPNLEWGINVPFDKTQKIWVWFDALLNYYTGVPKKYWDGKVLHLVGKDIQKFHCVIWPALLFSVKEKLPTTVFSHGFFTIDGQKISKSLGNAIDPIELSNKYSVDALRYYLIREIHFGQDGDFSETALKNRLNNELANDLGNLLSRTLTLVEKFYNGKIKKGKIDSKLKNKLNFKKIDSLIEKINLTEALSEIWKFIKEVNKYINDKKPWENEKERKDILYSALDSLRIIALLLSPFIPDTSEKINKQLNIKLTNFKDVKFGLLKEGKINKGEILFKKIEEPIQRTKEFKNNEIKPKPMIKYEDFQKLEIKVGKIKSAKEHPNADKLLILEVDTGDRVRQIVAGIKGHYSLEELKGKEIIVLTNLEPRDLRGFKSEGMLLAASDDNKIVILKPEKEIKPGSGIK